MKEDEITIHAVVVVYNKTCTNSCTCMNLDKIEGVNVIIVDNSSQEYGNFKFACEKNWDYINMGGNMGLSKAYNKAIEHIKNSCDFLCLFDDDSEISEEYFDCLRESVAADKKVKIFVPMTYGAKGLYSPSVEIKKRVRRARKISEITPENITAINNGMAIKREVFENYRYNEDYFLDYVDHAFLRDMRNMGVKISMMDVKLYHQMMFGSEKATKQSVISRFGIFRKDLKIFYCNSFRGRMIYYEMILRMKVNFTLRFRSIKMMFI